MILAPDINIQTYLLTYRQTDGQLPSSHPMHHVYLLIYFILRCCHSDSTNKNKMADEKETKKKTSVDIVAQQAILVETILKEERYQKLFTNYSINPFRKSK